MADLFHLQPVISDRSPSADLLDFDSEPKEGFIASAASSITSRVNPPPTGTQPNQEREIRCIEGYEHNIYVGVSDGTVEWWVCEGAAHSETNGWTMRRKQTLFPRRPVSKMYLLPNVSKILVISDGTMHTLSLPDLAQIPSNVIPPMRGVISVILNDDELDWRPGSEERTDMTVVTVRRHGLGIYKLGHKFQAIKEIPLPSIPTHHAIFQTYLCCALYPPSDDDGPPELTNCVIDLSDASLTPVAPVDRSSNDAEQEKKNANIVVIPGEDEFLVTSYSGFSTLGLFLNGQGDPVRGTIEWESHPLSIAVESGWIIALLSNQTISIHALDDPTTPTQVIPIPQPANAINLSYSPYGVRVQDLLTGERLKTVKSRFLAGRLVSNKEEAGDPPEEEGDVDNEDPPSGSGLTPPSSPQRPKRPSDIPFLTTTSETFVVTPSCIYSLTLTPPVLAMERLCEEHKLVDAIAFLDEYRRQNRKGILAPPSPVDQVSTSLLVRYLSSFLASHLTQDASFEKAGALWVKGKVDPRWIVRLFEGLRGKVIGLDEEGEVWQGLKEAWSGLASTDEIIRVSIKKNYSPHLPPSTSASPASADLRRALEGDANVMLLGVLRKTRASRRKGGGIRGVDGRKIDVVIDTVLAKLLTLPLPSGSNHIDELLVLLSSPNDVVLSELEPFLEERKYILAKVMRQEGKLGKVLDILQEMVEQDHGDPLCSDPLEEFASTLEGIECAEEWEKRVMWLVTRRPERALDVLINHSPPSLSPTDILPRLAAVDAQVHRTYLEHIVVTKRSPSRPLHQQLLDLMLDEASTLVQDDGIKYHLSDLNDEYRKEGLLQAQSKGRKDGKERETFIHFLARLAPDTPIKRLRLKLAFLLQGSPFYDVKRTGDRLEGIAELGWERAIVLGKLKQHDTALRLLALTLADPLTAQTYATTSGIEILSPRLAKEIASISNIGGLEHWATLGEVGRKRKGKVEVGDGEVRKLLDVYMADGTPPSLQSASLLLATLPTLPPLDPMLTSMPSDWPLDLVSPFFVRSLKKGEERRWEALVRKNIARGEYEGVEERWLEEVRKMKPVIQGRSLDRGREEKTEIDEKGEYDEKEEYVVDEPQGRVLDEKLQMPFETVVGETNDLRETNYRRL
ncbi:hypothetical protein B9479_002287 [Cryptococcus floricola]|uniref:CNH domain-containing protein n=1 Tax=Cryptococcus floricola TaxID=2591691 RepID=A0A5D3B1N3_9TREE|nr:hypothetical protein B9479_002287 [Cryptococcus floricola]